MAEAMDEDEQRPKLHGVAWVSLVSMLSVEPITTMG